ncbi:MAG: efflux transporter outer membrane subunit [Planctomycetota bacterium]
MSRLSPLLCLVLAACSAPGGQGGSYKAPTEDLLQAPFTSPAAVVAKQDLPAWWTAWQDPALESCVETMLAANLDLQAAAQAVLASEAAARAASGNRGPAVDLSLDASRGFVTPLGDGNRTYSTLLRPNLTIGWQADLFGKLKSTERSAWNQALASAEDHEALNHALIAQVVRQRVAISVLARRLDLARSVVASREGTLGIVEGRYQGAVQGTSAVDVHLARENLAAAKANVPALELSLEQARHAMNVLLGQPAGQALELPLAAALPPLAAPPVGMPAALLDARPDLRAAQFRTQAAAAQVDVALANLYPDLRLTGTAGWDSYRLEDLFDTDRLFASLIGDLTVRLFGSGTLSANVDAAKANLAASAARYRATILGALQEVEDALAAERLLRDQVEWIETQVREAQTAEDLARERYERGVGQLLTVLDTERRRAIAQDLALRLQQSIWNARVDLHLALGGDWQTETTPAPANDEIQ